MADPGNALPLEVEPAEVARLLEAAEPFLLLDCREPAEYETVSIDGARLLPMSQLQERVTELEPSKQQRIIVHCHHGVRSLQVTNWLRHHGFQAQSMAGGIDRWSVEIDPSKPRY